MAANSAPVDWPDIFDSCKGSIIFMMAKPIEDDENTVKEHQALCTHIRSVGTKKQQIDACEKNVFSTGFVVASKDGFLYIQTVAHGFFHIFNASTKLKLPELQKFYVPTIICDHYEAEFGQTDSTGERVYVTAAFVAVDSTQDLFLLKVKEDNLKQYSREDEVCGQNHMPLPFAPTPREMTSCMIISWPSYMHRKVAGGFVGPRRKVSEICTNRLGYSMTLLEVQIASEQGSSGAPLIDSCGRVIGVLHGGFGGGHSYFISSEDVLFFLRRYNIV